MWLGVVGFTGTSWADKPDAAGAKAQASDQGAEKGKGHQDDPDDAPAATSTVAAASVTTSASTENSGEGPGGKFECNESHHSDTGHGANTGDVYDSVCEPAAAGNGNGNGNQSGQPCAGCVGNADDKNPPGQMPDGSDGNNGYECDGNSGIGRTNPAHTRPCPTPTENPPNNPPGNNPELTTTGTPAVAAAAEVLGVSFTRAATPAAPAPAVAALAFTGANVSRELTVAASLLLLGTFLVLVARRREPVEA